MEVEFALPSLGADMESATLTQWLKQPGEAVRQGEPLVTVETTKGLIDVESYDSGKVLEHLVPPGTEVPVGTALARLEISGTSRAPHPAAPAKPTPTVQPPSAPATAQTPAAPRETTRRRTRISPAARRRAQELGVSIEDVARIAPGDIVHLKDVEKLAGSRAPAPGDARAAMRAAIGAAMARAKRDIPHYYLGHSIDFQPARDWLTRHNAPLAVKERVLEVVLVTKAVALAASRIEGFSGHFNDGQFHPSPAVHVGAAIAVRGGGLVAPALLDAHQKDLPTLMREFSDLVLRVRAGHMRSGEFSAATITLTSLGTDGVDILYPIINPPQVAIVGAGAIREQPWAQDGQILAKPVLTLTLAADHRVTDGRTGARFLRAIADLLAHPEAL